MKELQWLTVEPDSLGVYFENKPIRKSKGAGKGHKEIYILTELFEGAWECYISTLDERNHALTTLHLDYLKTRSELLAHNDPNDLEAFRKRTIDARKKYHLKYAYVRNYLSLTMDEFKGPRVRMPQL